MSALKSLVFILVASLCSSTFANRQEDGDDMETEVDCTPERFQNQPLGPLDFECPCGGAITGIDSCFTNTTNGTDFFSDRQFLFTCQTLSAIRKESCMWLSVDLVLPFGDNDNGTIDPTILFQCPADYYMAGVRNVYVGGDRTWDIKCCQLDQWCQRDCIESGNFTVPTADFSFSVPPDPSYKSVYPFVGLFSYLDEEVDDRGWKAIVCRFSLCEFYAFVEAKLQADTA